MKTENIYDEVLVINESIDLKNYYESDLLKDKKKMWQIELIRHPNGLEMVSLASPNSAINAANRVLQFEKNNLIGLSKSEALKKIHYDGKFRVDHNLSKHLLMLSFSNEKYLLQFDAMINSDGKIEAIHKKLILNNQKNNP